MRERIVLIAGPYSYFQYVYKGPCMCVFVSV